LWLGAEARELGTSGVAEVARATGVSARTVRRGWAELDSPEGAPPAVSRRPGGGRKRAEAHDPDLAAALDDLIDPSPRTDPMSPLRWTCRSTRSLAAELRERDHWVSDYVVRRLLKQAGYRLHANPRTADGRRHANWDAQLRYVNEQVRYHRAAGFPVVSIDAYKSDLATSPTSNGREWPYAHKPVEIIGPDVEPYPGGARPPWSNRLPADAKWIAADVDRDTAAFAVATLLRWWQVLGRAAHPSAVRLMVAADGGGDAYGTDLWSAQLAVLAADLGLRITVCHLPPATSKWTKIEYQLASTLYASQCGRLTSHEVAIAAVAAAEHPGANGSDRRASAGTLGADAHSHRPGAALIRHSFCGEWNYTLLPDTGRRGEVRDDAEYGHWLSTDR
jgi:hypothetical protein